MLTHISVQNYALIRQLEIDFTQGFTVITGETGAGKSILLGALNLMLGKRTDTQVLLDKSKKCIVEGIFSIDQYNLRDFFTANDLEYDLQAILRREISANGKSRAFINDSPVSISLLKELGEQLIDIHSQHQTITLNDSNFQLTVIDSFSGITEDVKNYKTHYKNFIRLKTEIDRLTEEEKKLKNEQDYFEYLFKELDDARLSSGEQEQLESELKVHNHAEEIKSRLSFSTRELGEIDNSILSRLAEVRSNLNQIAAFSDDLTEISSRVESNLIEITDIYGEIQKNLGSVAHDPSRIAEIKERLDLIYHLQNKHRVNNIEELIVIKDELNLKLNDIGSLDDKIEKLNKDLLQLEKEVLKEAKKLSDIRKKNFVPIEKEISGRLMELGMPYARFSIHNQSMSNPGKDGLDTVRFLFNANKGGEMQELSKVASGGELSRLMLVIKSLISQKNLLPSVVFDEIDIGVSGKVADKVGSILHQLSRSMQVIAITHLPQIAGKGDAHYFVYKETDANTTKTEIRILDREERVLEIAKMLSGQEVTTSSVETAKHLLK
jgi:DNA repair protein RecN (Recombination protein N)